MALLIDTFSYNGEPIVEARIEYLYKVVDLFVIVESRYTHSGIKKEQLYCEKHANVFKPYLNKIKFLIIDEFPPMPEDWPQTNGEGYMNPSSFESWWRERYQRDVAGEYLLKNYINQPLIVIATDADEIIRADVATELKTQYYGLRNPLYLEMKFYYYNFEWQKPYPWHLGFVVNDFGLQQNSLSNYRTKTKKANYIRDAGWHASYFLNTKDLARKLESFAHRECDLDERKTQEHLRNCIERGVDIAMRDNENCEKCTVDHLPPIFQDFQKKLLFLQRYSG